MSLQKIQFRAEQLLHHFMLTAGSGENDLGLQSYGVVKHNVGGNVAGMERNDQVRLFGVVEVRNVFAEKFHALKAQFGGGFPAEVHHILF